MPKKVNWVFFDAKTGEVCCERCDDRKNLSEKLPLSVTDFTTALNGFGKLHSICKDKNER